MGLRPAAARWFEVLAPKEQLSSALSCLASTGAVELQTHSQSEPVPVLPELDPILAEVAELEQRFEAYWPAPSAEPETEPRDPREVLTAAMRRVRTWVTDAEPIIEELFQREREAQELRELSDVLCACGEQLPELHRLASAGPYLSTRLYRMPSDAIPETLSPSVIVQWLECGGRPHLLATGPIRQVERLDEQLVQLKGARIVFPAWLPPGLPEAVTAVERRRHEITERAVELGQALASLHDVHRLASARADLAFLAWLGCCAPTLPVTEHFAWITGWTSDLDGRALESALERGAVDHVLRFSEPPPGATSPVVLTNPPWIRPFETFARLMGVPANDEADPSVVVAVLAPLMFGYMFGDVGQGAVLLGLGLWLRGRFPVLGLLVSGGLFAIAFGFAFGSVFSVEGIIPALWIHPLEHPLVILGVTLAAGVVILALGLVLDIMQAFWRRRLGRWLALRGGLVLAWMGAVGAVAWSPAAWLILVGGLWFVVGRLFVEPIRPGPAGVFLALGAGIGELVESLLQLLVNTVSFVRVGAFALAHAGLSSAVVGMAVATGSTAGAAVVLVLGNLAIIALEGLVVAIQTTRLVLFEFFTRFLVASGRPLRPLLRPGGPEITRAQRPEGAQPGGSGSAGPGTRGKRSAQRPEGAQPGGSGSAGPGTRGRSGS